MALNGRALLQHLPQDVRGQLVAHAPLAQQTWFGVGGVAEILFKPVDENDLASFLARCPADIPVMVIGVASNLLIRDGGIPGVVIKLGPSFGLVKIIGGDVLAGAAAVDLNVARAAEIADIADLEFLSGIPGTVGGGLRMNAGAYGHEFKDIVVEATVILRNGEKRVMSNAELGFSYRHSSAPEDCVFVSALLRGKKSDAAQIKERMAMIQKSRLASQPIREKTGGSTFANPEDDPQQRKAWQLIEAADCRNLKLGDAQVSRKHCNFLINTGNATATDIETLGEIVRHRVLDKFGIDLRWEIKRIGLKS